MDLPSQLRILCNTNFPSGAHPVPEVDQDMKSGKTADIRRSKGNDLYRRMFRNSRCWAVPRRKIAVSMLSGVK